MATLLHLLKTTAIIISERYSMCQEIITTVKANKTYNTYCFLTCYLLLLLKFYWIQKCDSNNN